MFAIVFLAVLFLHEDFSFGDDKKCTKLKYKVYSQSFN